MNVEVIPTQWQQDADRLVHELYVHQTELKAQNEELRRIQAELELGKARYFELYDMAPVGYLTLSEHGLILEANLTAETLLGQTRSALKMQPISNFIFKEDQDTYYKNRIKLCEGQQQAQACYLRLVKNDNSKVWVHLSANLMRHDGATVHRVVLSDISLQKKADESLNENKGCYRQLIEDLPVGVILQGPQSEIISANAKALALLGLTEDQLMGNTAFDADWNVIHEDGTPFPGSTHPVPQAIATGQAVHNVIMGVYRSLTQDRVWLMVNAELQFNPDGSVSLVVCTLDEITVAKKAEESRIRQSILIEKLSRRLVEGQEQERLRFSRELHDRTSPNLAALRINLKIITKCTAEMRASQSYADRLEDTQALIEDTTFSVRDICSELHPPLLDTGGVLGMVQSYAFQFSKRTSLPVSVQCPHGEIRLAPDRELALFRIVQEALTNCAKHAMAKLVLVRLQLDTDPMLLSILDDGVGIDLEAPITDGYARGQGLLNMKGAAEFMGGHFALESLPGGGTRVCIEI